ncbi:MAG: hypothetical protein CTY18_12000 [Methylomonas sp.]|nr:MAG: hypothetical protein CTY18_12000 [Methylomonas sp.]
MHAFAGFKALGSSPANLTHSRCDRWGGNNSSSPIKAMALVWAMPLMPVNNSKTRSSAGYWRINAKASVARASMRFSSWVIASRVGWALAVRAHAQQ